MPTATIGSLIKERRTQAKYSQMHLALDVGISARHFHPEGFGRSTKHFARGSSYLLRQLDLLASRYPDVTPLADEVAAWPDLPRRDTWRHIQEEANYAHEPVLTWEAEINGQELVVYTMMSTFGTPSDITLSELTLELFFPADQHTETALRSRSTRRVGSPLARSGGS
jgi:MmyB-like transcription regulator ligand binding domain